MMLMIETGTHINLDKVLSVEPLRETGYKVILPDGLNYRVVGQDAVRQLQLWLAQNRFSMPLPELEPYLR